MAKNVLDMILWHPKMEIKNCNITYIHRGTIGNLKTISGNQINKLERGFLILNEGTQIPCHRIVKIRCDNKVMWNK
jgi:uncharacterized protein